MFLKSSNNLQLICTNLNWWLKYVKSPCVCCFKPSQYPRRREVPGGVAAAEAQQEIVGQALGDVLDSAMGAPSSVQLPYLLWCFVRNDNVNYIVNDRRKLRSQTSDNMDRWKSRGGKSQRGEAKKWEERRCRCAKRKERRDSLCFFPMICGSGWSKSRLAKAAGAETSGQIRDEKLHAVVSRSTCRSQHLQNTSNSEHFWKLSCRKSARQRGAKHISKSKCIKHTRFGPLLEVQLSKKVHAVVARSTFPSQNVQSTSASVHCWKFRCRKSAPGCGAKHISKSKCTKHTSSGPLLELEMSKKCTPMWREAHVEVKMHKAHHCRATFGTWGVEKVHAPLARSTFPSQNVQNIPFSQICRKSARHFCAKHIYKWKCSKHHMPATTFDALYVVFRGRRKGLCTLSKVCKTWGLCSTCKNDGRRGTFEEHLQRCISRGRHSTRDMLHFGASDRQVC